jgi:hypothetical protein
LLHFWVVIVEFHDQVLGKPFSSERECHIVWKHKLLSSHRPGSNECPTTALFNLIGHTVITVSSIPHVSVVEPSAQVDEQVVDVGCIALGYARTKLSDILGLVADGFREPKGSTPVRCVGFWNGDLINSDIIVLQIGRVRSW